MFCRRWRRLVGIAYREGHAEGSAYAHALEARVEALEARLDDPEALAEDISQIIGRKTSELRHRRPNRA